MFSGNLCLFAILAAIVALPTVRQSDVAIPQSGTRATKSPGIEVPPAVFLRVQSRNPNDLGPGKLLVASRELSDPSFAETVILLVHCDADGVIGLMLNRRTDLPISRVLAQIKTAKNRSDPVYLGGPVETPSVFALLRSTDKLDDAERVFGDIYWISKKTTLEKAMSSRAAPSVFHIYLGYAGWTTEQLRNEVRLGAWFVFPADNKAIFNANPNSLWHEMIKKTELKMAGKPAGVSRRHRPIEERSRTRALQIGNQCPRG